MFISDGEFTSESVSDGHPDKICDLISDAILDAHLAQDPDARVAIECAVKGQDVFVLGEATSHADVDVDAIVRRVFDHVGHVDGRWGIVPAQLNIATRISRQSPEIQAAVNGELAGAGAGDQGTVFGYACDETPDFMPAALALAHAMMRQHKHVRGSAPGIVLGPDAKAQATIRYHKGRPSAVSTLVLSTQHVDSIDLEAVRDLVRSLIVEPVLADFGLNADRILINSGGPFTLGGPLADAGLTGRKIIVDTYGGRARHGGGAFSGKDPTKVDRSGAYGARQLAKTIVAAGLATHCEVRASYAIGEPKPVSVALDTFGTGDPVAIDAAFAAHDLNPYTLLAPSSLISRLQLNRAIYADTAAFGHFGGKQRAWEKVLWPAPT